MARRLLNYCFWVSMLSQCFGGVASANGLIWYDAQRQAIATNPWIDGFGDSTEIDFNADHTGAAIVMEGAGNAELGYITAVGTYDTVGGNAQYGWAALLGSLAPISGFSAMATTVLEDPIPSFDQFYYFAEEWDVAAGKTTIFVQPMQAGVPVPVTKDMLGTTFVRFDEGDWVPFADAPEVRLPVTVDVRVSPSVLQRGAGSDWVIGTITLPEGYAVDDLLLDIVTLTLAPTIYSNGGAPFEAAYILDTVGSHGRTLTAKFSRLALLYFLPPGRSTLYVSGSLRHGPAIHGMTSIVLME